MRNLLRDYVLITSTSATLKSQNWRKLASRVFKILRTDFRNTQKLAKTSISGEKIKSSVTVPAIFDLEQILTIVLMYKAVHHKRVLITSQKCQVINS